MFKIDLKARVGSGQWCAKEARYHVSPLTFKYVKIGVEKYVKTSTKKSAQYDLNITKIVHKPPPLTST